MTRPVLACAAILLSWSLAAPLLAQTAATPPAQTSAASPVPTGNAEIGKRLYTEKRCFFCHGTEGQGGERYPRIARVQRGADNFVRYVRQPAAMAAYSEQQISNTQLLDIYAFLRALPAPKAVTDIPLLNQLKAPGK
jgi:mono/diheme cytochrome c family protein